MGTRADFYIGRGEAAEWLGSIAWDGYPSGIETWVFAVSTEQGFRDAVNDFLSKREDATFPKDGWPWPWEDSQTTDYAYAFDGDQVFASRFGGSWFDPREKEPEHGHSGKSAVFPNMKDKQRVTFGKRSGVMIF